MNILSRTWSLFKQREDEDFILYKVHCECADDRHNHTLVLEYDDHVGMITMTIATEVESTNWETNWFKDYLKRCWLAIKLIFTGKLRMEGSVLIVGSENIEHMINGLQTGLNKMKCFENQFERKQDENN